MIEMLALMVEFAKTVGAEERRVQALAIDADCTDPILRVVLAREVELIEDAIFKHL